MDTLPPSAVFIAVVIIAVAWISLAFAAGDYRIARCAVPDRSGATLIFRNKIGQEFILEFRRENGRALVRGTLSKVPIDLSSMVPGFVAKATKDPNVATFIFIDEYGYREEIGLIDKACFARLSEHFKDELRIFEDTGVPPE